MKALIAVSLTAAVLFIFSCKKEPVNTPEYNLTRGGTRTWKIQDIRGGENGRDQLLIDCRRNDAFDFLHNGKWFYGPGEVRCNETDTINSGSWSFNNEKTQINISSSGEWGGSYQINELTTEKLVLVSGGRTYTFTCGCKK